MKRTAIIAIAAAGFAAPAFAAEFLPQPSYVVPVFAPDSPPAAAPLFTKAPPMVVTAFSWTGCYIGGHLGGAVSEDTETGYRGRSVNYDPAGVVGGGQIGCDYQFAPRWVAGVEGRIAGTSLKYSHAATVTNLTTGITLPAQFTVNNDFLASTTARLGYSFAERWLVYVRGGAAWTDDKADDAYRTVAGIAVDPSATLTRTGWTAGTGVEWAFAPHWSATLEYNYYDFGTAGIRLTDTANNVFVTGISLKDTIHAVTVGMNYRF